MIDFFKQKEQKPFAYPSIEMRKSSNKSLWWVIGIISLIVITLLFVIKI